MSEIVDFFGRAVAEFDRRVAAVGDDQWTDPTPCQEWDVRAVVNHITVEDLWTPLLLEGKTLDEVGGRFDGDQLGADPKSAWAGARDGALAAVGAGIPDRVHTSMGEIPATEYLGQLFSDHLIHAWDLARGIGADDELDPELVSVCYRLSVPAADIMQASGLFGSQVVPPPGSSPQVRLLALYGRQA